MPLPGEKTREEREQELATSLLILAIASIVALFSGYGLCQRVLTTLFEVMDTDLPRATMILLGVSMKSSLILGGVLCVILISKEFVIADRHLKTTINLGACFATLALAFITTIVLLLPFIRIGGVV